MEILYIYGEKTGMEYPGIQEGRHCSWVQFSRPTTKILIHIDTEKHYYLQLTLMFTCTWAYTSRVYDSTTSSATHLTCVCTKGTPYLCMYEGPTHKHWLAESLLTVKLTEFAETNSMREALKAESKLWAGHVVVPLAYYYVLHTVSIIISLLTNWQQKERKFQFFKGPFTWWLGCGYMLPWGTLSYKIYLHRYFMCGSTSRS